MQIKNLLSIAITAALKAGEKILEVYNSDDFDIQIKDDKSPLTYADRKSHDTIIQILNKTSIPILSEEGKTINYEIRKNWNPLWLIDPLDGTKEFIKRNDEFTVNIALIKDNKPILGVIYIPVLSVLYFGADTIDAYKVDCININSLNQNQLTETNLIDILINKATKLPLNKETKNIVIVASRSHMSVETEEFINAVKENCNEVEMVSRGSSLKICMIAEGKADAYPRFAPTMEWDTAAGHAIVSASGAIITESDYKTPLSYNKNNLTNPWFIARHKEFKIPDKLISQ
jgi:3'(2'), 5'-bisphosphate nucleotidase